MGLPVIYSEAFLNLQNAPRQKLSDTLKADLVKFAQGTDLEASKSADWWRKVVEAM